MIYGITDAFRQNLPKTGAYPKNTIPDYAIKEMHQLAGDITEW